MMSLEEAQRTIGCRGRVRDEGGSRYVYARCPCAAVECRSEVGADTREELSLEGAALTAGELASDDCDGCSLVKRFQGIYYRLVGWNREEEEGLSVSDLAMVAASLVRSE